MRQFIHLSYVGTSYSGWQWQKSTPLTIQQVLTRVIRNFLKDETISINGCGRTDAGVHASQYFAHVDTHHKFDQKDLFILNKQLPIDITIHDIFAMDEKAHARFDATHRTYDYFIHFQKDNYLNPYSLLLLNMQLDVDAMQKCVQMISEHNDFNRFCKSPDKHNHTICHIQEVRLLQSSDGRRMHFQITSDRFLKGMIRILVQTLIEVGKGSFSPNQFLHLLQSTSDRKHKKAAGPQGLHLSKIVYPYLNIPVASTIYQKLKQLN